MLKNPQPEIRYIDLFSGPGIYDDGHESTPLMIADECYRNDQLRAIVRMQFNDKNYKEILEKNFLEKYPRGTFGHEPFFADRTIGECESVEMYLQRSTMKDGKNLSPV